MTYGFLKALLDNSKTLKPEGVAIAFDTAEPTFRHKADANYKAHRDVALRCSSRTSNSCSRSSKRTCSSPLHGTGLRSRRCAGNPGEPSGRLGMGRADPSGDRDLFQLVDDSRDIAVLYMGGGPYAKSSGPTLIREEGVLGKLGVMPDKVVDLKALTGDSSDNIPGVRVLARKQPSTC